MFSKMSFLKLPIKCFLYCFNSIGDLNNSSLPLDTKDSVEEEKEEWEGRKRGGEGKEKEEEREKGKKEKRRRKGEGEEWNMKL